MVPAFIKSPRQAAMAAVIATSLAVCSAVEHLPVLTVGDASRFAARGGDIGFVLKERR
ncbi:MAG TPA: hypothetical protein VNJ03_01870 [Vicinamibacterales bacterium]|nr:hypothetical protein [Vicinamibacterales bacterium]